MIKDKNLEISICEKYLTDVQSDWLLDHCLSQVKWGQDKYNFSGREVLAPRLTALYGNKPYRYSGQTLYPVVYGKALSRLNDLVSEIAGVKFNVVLLNQYRNGQDSVSWHADNESVLGKNPVIASLSLGGTRGFTLRNNADHTLQHKLLLSHGDLLIMRGETQHFWQHCVPKSKKYNNLRINLTFRVIV
jgi:alkylated DNA repair dioxygenase AlkB